MSRSDTGRVRPVVWIPAALVIVLALGISLGTLDSLGSASRKVPVPAAAALSLPAAPRAAAAAPLAAPAPGTARPGAPPPVAAGEGTGAAVLPRRTGDVGTAAALPSSRRRSASASEPKDPELARRLYVAESDAARRAIGLGLVTPEQLDAAAGSAAAPASAGSTTSANGSSAGSSAAVRTASDALLEEYLLRKEYQGTTFPQGYPAQKSMRSVVRSRIGNLDAPARLALLNRALQDMASLPQGPLFSTDLPPVAAAASQ